jgi:hypothetical protein
MLGLIESLVAISAVIVTCRFAGRIPAMMVTAVAAASAAIIMPPFASWEVESTTDVLTVVFQTIIGLALAYKWPAKNGTAAKQNSPPQLRRGGAKRRGGAGQTLQFVYQRHPSLGCASAFPSSAEEGNRCSVLSYMAKVPIEVLGELHDLSGVSADKLRQILFDVMKLVASDSRTQQIKVFTSRRPSLNVISLVAEYDSSPSLPHVRILGRSGSQCAIRMKDWPANCSATRFDNGFEHIYQISIREIREETPNF